MLDSPPVCVVDANILIDLHAGGVLQLVFGLPFSLAAPNVLIAELQEPDAEQLLRYGLKSVELSGRDVQKMQRLAALHKSVAVNDLFALILAKTLGATLLTGDRHLRQAAEREGVSIHGTLWLLDEIVRLKMASPWLAAQALRNMLDRDSRLPLGECEKRLKRWNR